MLAVANQKGGVAKTTTVHSLGVASAEAGCRTLVVDLDPQACLTYSVGFDPDALGRSLHDVFVRRAGLAEVILPVPGVGSLDLVPATIDLAGSEVHLLTRTAREHVLERALAPVRRRYDIVLIDCPPSLGVLTINGLTAADAVLIPLQCEALSHRGVGQLLETIEDVRMFANAELSVRGVIATMYDDRTRHARHVIDEVEAVVTDSRCSSRRCASRSGSPKHQRGGSASSSTRRPPRGPRPTVNSPAPFWRPARSPAPSTRAVPGPDPLGKRALFWAPVEPEAEVTGESGRAADGTVTPPRPLRRARPAGRHALFSEATPASENEKANCAALTAEPVPPAGCSSSPARYAGRRSASGSSGSSGASFLWRPGCRVGPSTGA